MNVRIFVVRVTKCIRAQIGAQFTLLPKMFMTAAADFQGSSY